MESGKGWRKKKESVQKDSEPIETRTWEDVGNERNEKSEKEWKGEVIKMSLGLKKRKNIDHFSFPFSFRLCPASTFLMMKK